MKHVLSAALVAVPIAALLGACTPAPQPEALRPVRTVEVRYDVMKQSNRYVGTVHARHEVEQAFRVPGKVAQRKVEVGQTVRAGDVLAVLDDADYRLAVDAAQQALLSATAQARQAESDRVRLEVLKQDGSVSRADDERAHSAAVTAKAAQEAEARKLELARNRLAYTVLRASQAGVVTAVRFEAGQVVAEGLPVVAIAGSNEPEIVVDIPEDHLAGFEGARFRAFLASAPDKSFDATLRELSPQAASQTRTYRARLKPANARRLPLGATATVIAERAAGNDTPVATLPAAAMSVHQGKAAVWVVERSGGDAVGTVHLRPVEVRGYRSDEVLVTGLPAGALVVSAGVQKMAPELRVALTASPVSAVIGQAQP